MEPLVSVIIPNYNHAQYLDQRIQSVLNQTYSNFEVIILDDKSSDNSLEIIEKYKGNPHIATIVSNETNSGSPFKQWNKGISLAKGKIVWIAESDDFCELNFLEVLISAYKKTKDCAIVYCNVCVINDKNEAIGSSNNNNIKYFTGEEYIHKYLTLGCSINNASGAIFNKEKALLIPKTFVNMRAAGDYMFWTEMALHGSVTMVERELSYFRRHEGVETDKRSADGSNFIADREIFDYICERVNLTKEEKDVAFAHHALMASKTIFYDNVFPVVNKSWNIEEQIADYFNSRSPENLVSKIKLESIVTKHLRQNDIDRFANCGYYLSLLAKESKLEFLKIAMFLLKFEGIGQTLFDYKVAIKLLLKNLV